MFQYAAVKPLPLNYTSMAESFYSRTLDSLSLWVRGLNPEVKEANIFYNSFTFLFACLPCTMGFVNQNWNWKSKYSHFLCIREFNTSWCSTSLSFVMLKSKVNSMKTEILFAIFAIFGDFLAKIERKCWFSPITIFKTFYQRTNWVLLHSHKNGTCTI